MIIYDKLSQYSHQYIYTIYDIYIYIYIYTVAPETLPSYEMKTNGWISETVEY